MTKIYGYTSDVSKLLLVLVLGSLAMTNLHAQGALTPPGAPGPTMKSLDQIEPRTPIATIPFTISTSGSYYLITNLVQTNSSFGISIKANDVVLDLNGFTLRGNGSFSQGVTINSATNVTIHHGTFVGWGQAGIISSSSKNITVREVATRGNFFGIYLTDADSIVEACSAVTNASVGLGIGDNGHVRNCTADGNGSGIVANGVGALVEDSVANYNSGPGFSVQGNECVVSHCTASGNSGDGITAVDGNQVLDTMANFNKGNGIFCTFSCTINRCLVSANTSNGISASARSEVRDNFCNGNLGAGIFIPVNGLGLGGTRVDNNHITSGTVGIQMNGPGNFVVHNTVSGTTGSSYVINSNNIVGVIVLCPKSLAINGSSGGAGVGTTDPAANFTF